MALKLLQRRLPRELFAAGRQNCDTEREGEGGRAAGETYRKHTPSPYRRAEGPPTEERASVAIGGLTPLTTYYFRIRGFNGLGNSPYSNTAQATTTSQVALLDFSGGFAG